MTKEELIAKMYEVSTQMNKLSISMQYFAGLDKEVIEKSKQLAGASSMLVEWGEHLSQKNESHTEVKKEKHGN